MLALIAAQPGLALVIAALAGVAGLGLGLWIGRRRTLPHPAAVPMADPAPAAPAANRAPVSAAPAPSPPTPAARTGPPRAPAPSAERTSLGRYRIDGLLGRGAMGAVYSGHDPATGRALALKTLALGDEFTGASLEEARRRFFREAEAAGRLRHPDIVEIDDAGVDDGLAWIAMERLRGRDLTAYTQPDRLLPAEEAVAVVARVAEALAFAHARGVVHRDIKPANVMIDPATAQVKVTDFGVARITDAARTRTGVMLGTPAYMSPEQLSGARVDGRSDLYSLGVLLFQLLTGRLPHEAASMARLMFAIANEPPPDLRSLRPDLPAALADAVALALQKRPEMRCADGRAWAADLRTIAGMPPAPPVPGATQATAPAPGAGAPPPSARRNTVDPMQNPRS